MAKAGFSFELQGIPGFEQVLEQYGDEVRAGVSALMEETAHDIRDEARLRVSEDEGDLRDEIIVEGKGLAWRVGISDAVITRRGSNRIHQRPFIYGAILERGDRNQTHNPFMRPAADIHLARFESRLPSLGVVI